MRREALKYLYDIQVAGEKIQRFTKGRSEAEYLTDELLQSAVERQFEIIGEAVGQLRKVSPRVVEKIADYQKMISFRNILIHGYAVVDPMIVWGVVEENLMDLLSSVGDLLSSNYEDK